MDIIRRLAAIDRIVAVAGMDADAVTAGRGQQRGVDEVAASPGDEAFDAVECKRVAMPVRDRSGIGVGRESQRDPGGSGDRRAGEQRVAAALRIGAGVESFAAGATVIGVRGTAAGGVLIPDQQIGASAAIHGIAARATIERVIASITGDQVGIGATNEGIAACGTRECGHDFPPLKNTPESNRAKLCTY